MNIIGASLVERVKGLAALRETRRFALPLLGGVLALSVAACSSSSGGSGDSVVSSLTGPDQQQQEAAGPGQVQPISFAPVIGAPAKVSSKMNESLVAAAKQNNIPVASSGQATYTIRGYLVAAPDPKGAKLSYIWDITDQNGKRAKRFQGDEVIEGKKGGDAWDVVDDQVIDRIAQSTTSKIAGWMSGSASAASAGSAGSTAATSGQQQASAPAQRQQQAQRSAPQQTASAQPAPSSSVLSAQAEQRPQRASQSQGPQEIVAVVPPVAGAPGDGQQSLTAAMRRHLRNAGVKLTDNGGPNAYTVRGTVQLGSADGGQQPITIRWLVVDPSGNTMDKAVVQRNKVPAGSLDGQWGQVADLAAGEAAKSVAKLIKPTG